MRPARLLIAVVLILAAFPVFSTDGVQAPEKDGLLYWFPELNSWLSFDVPTDVSDRLETYPQSRFLLDQYKFKNAWGTSLLWWGIPVWLGGMGLYLTSIEISATPNHYDPFMLTSVGVVGLGLIMIGTGAWILPSSYKDMLDSVHAYNDLTFKRLSESP